MKPKLVYFIAPNGKKTLRCATYALSGGGFLHFDHYIQPIRFGPDLIKVPPLTVTPPVARKLRGGKPRSTAGVAKALILCASLLLCGCRSSFDNRLLLLRTYVSTNVIPGYIGGPQPTVGPDGNLTTFANAVAIHYPPSTNVVTNYVIGYRRGGTTIEVLKTP